VLVEHVFARVQLIRDDAPRDAVVPVLRHPRLAGVVRRARRRTPAYLPKRGELTRLGILVVGAFLPDETRARPPVERLSDGPGRHAAGVGRDEGRSTVVVGRLDPRTVDIVLEDLRDALADPVHPFAPFVVLQGRPGLRAVDEFDRRLVSVEFEIS